MHVATAQRQPWRLDARNQRRFDSALAAALLLPVLVFPLAELPWEWTALGVFQIVPLFWRRTRPGAVFAVVALASALQVVVVDVPLWSQLAFPVALYSVARFAGALAAAGALATGLCGAVVAALDWLLEFPMDIRPSTFAPFFLTISAIVVTSWALGTLGRTRAAYVDALLERGDRIEREAAQQVALAASQERARIAREMHDVVAHGLSVIVVQADGARYAAARDPGVAVSTLATISKAGRESLTEMRSMLGLLRADDGPETLPQPQLPDIVGLVEQTGPGVTSELVGLGHAVPDGLGLTAYRIVQEALSNVRRHAGPAASAEVRVHVTSAAVEIRVVDDGRGAAAPDDGRGHGLLGMRERVAVHGGELKVGPRSGGGYRVHATIPLNGPLR